MAVRVLPNGVHYPFIPAPTLVYLLLLLLGLLVPFQSVAICRSLWCSTLVHTSTNMSMKIKIAEKLLDMPERVNEQKRLCEISHCFPILSSRYIDIESNTSGSGSSDSTDVSDTEAPPTPLKEVMCDIGDSSSESDDGFEEISEYSTSGEEETIEKKKNLFKRLLLWAKRVLRPRTRPF